MKIKIYFFILLLTAGRIGAQTRTAGYNSIYSDSSIFAHNDYAQPIPFYTAVQSRVGYIEADVFLRNDSLLVAHDIIDLHPARRLDNMYLIPLDSMVKKKDGNLFSYTGQKITLSIDLKSEGVSTLNQLVRILGFYPDLIHSAFVSILISGNVPDPMSWDRYPSFIHFDGRPGIDYKPNQWDRINLVSGSFRNYTSWNGVGKMPSVDAKRVEDLVALVHARNKKLRLWATPDTEDTWNYLMSIGVDVLGTDEVKSLQQYIHRIKR